MALTHESYGSWGVLAVPDARVACKDAVVKADALNVWSVAPM